MEWVIAGILISLIGAALVLVFLAGAKRLNEEDRDE